MDLAMSPPRSQKKSKNGAVKSAKKPKFDLYTLYENSVMSPDSDVEFMIRSFKKIRGRRPKLFREDFCQTALIACEWVKHHAENIAWAIDLDPTPLNWAEEYNVPLAGEAKDRLHLVNDDVMKVKLPKVDITCALNFSYFYFKKREQLLTYFKSAYKGLKDDGVFYLDIMGGPDAQEVTEDKTNQGYFTYIWDQSEFNPINNHCMYHIHFKLRKGKMIKKAFSYDWRLWSVPEVRDILKESGFREVRIYWEDEDKDGEGTGTYRWRKAAENSVAWVAYIVAVK